MDKRIPALDRELWTSDIHGRRAWAAQAACLCTVVCVHLRTLEKNATKVTMTTCSMLSIDLQIFSIKTISYIMNGKMYKSLWVWERIWIWFILKGTSLTHCFYFVCRNNLIASLQCAYHFVFTVASLLHRVSYYLCYAFVMFDMIIVRNMSMQSTDLDTKLKQNRSLQGSLSVI